jgi:tetratricopeptide (TPR) repeat protein
MSKDAKLKALEEANKLMSQGDSWTKKTLTRWKPDWQQAAVCFDEAAKKFRILGPIYQNDLATALMRAGEAYEEINSLNTAGKCYSQAGELLRKLAGRKEDAIKVAKKASALYLANEQADKAATTLVKAAALVGEDDAQQAMALYHEAIDMFLDNGKEIFSHDIFKQGIAFACRKGLFEEAVGLLNRQTELYVKASKSILINRNCTGVIIMLLFLKQTAAAKEAIARFPSCFPGSDEHKACTMMIEGFEEVDQDKVDKAKSSFAIKNVDNQIARIARSLAVDPDAEVNKALFGDDAVEEPEAKVEQPEEEEILI